jgi:hypothetical protein
MSANNYFQIERNRRVSIAIPGYDPEKQVAKEITRLSKSWPKKDQKPIKAAAPPVEVAFKTEKLKSKVKKAGNCRSKSNLPPAKDQSNLILQAMHECEPDKGIRGAEQWKEERCD